MSPGVHWTTRVLGERLRKSIAAEPFALGGGQSVAVTVSGGCAVGDGYDPEELVRRADRALYAAKAGGRDRIVVDEEAPQNSRLMA